MVELAWISPPARLGPSLLPGHVGPHSPSPHQSLPPPLSSICPHPATSHAALPGPPDPKASCPLWMFVAFISWVDQMHRRCHQQFLWLLELTRSPLAALPVLSCHFAGLSDLGNKNTDAQLYLNQFLLKGTPIVKNYLLFIRNSPGILYLIWQPYLHGMLTQGTIPASGWPRQILLLLEICSLISETWKFGVAGMSAH